MAVLTPTRKNVYSLGNVIGIEGTFSSVANGDTWAPGLTTVQSCYIDPGVSGQTNGATYSGGTITIAASGAMANTKILAIGT